MRKHILRLSRYPALVGHPGQRRMSDTMRKDYYGPKTAQNMHCTVRDFHICARNGTMSKHKRNLQLFLISGLLEFVAMDLIGLPPKIVKEFQHVVVISNRCSNLIRLIPTARLTTRSAACMFLRVWNIQYGVPTYLPADSGMKFSSKCFYTHFIHLGT